MFCLLARADALNFDALCANFLDRISIPGQIPNTQLISMSYGLSNEVLLFSIRKGLITHHAVKLEMFWLVAQQPASLYRELVRIEGKLFTTNQCDIRNPHGRKPLYSIAPASMLRMGID